MSPVLSQSGPKGKARIFAPNAKPLAIAYRPGQPATITFADGQAAVATCLRCNNTPCMALAPEETALAAFPDFPADRRDNVCASDAMKRDPQTGAPIIDATRCMLCGVCALRCPVGAIHLSPNQGAIVQDTPNALIIDSDADPAATTLANAALLKNVTRTGLLLLESQLVLGHLERRLPAAVRAGGDNFPNVLARNLLIAAGVGTAMRRKGGNFMRMDLVLGAPGVETGLVEVEFGDEAILDAPRDVMDAVAVLVSRYAWKKQNIVAAIVGDILPNRRSEYWRIIQDIDRVLGIRIGTISLLSLLLHVWNRRPLQLTTQNAFYADSDTQSYRTAVIEANLGRPLTLPHTPHPLVEPAK
ncbi:MAG TPA: 4Fe-4S binding protein [Verrucomicrobiota bacterium]|nr:4Fe-4S binding protein [Verrucomicrobiota bacterium]